MEAGSIIWSIKRLRGYLWGTYFRFFGPRGARKPRQDRRTPPASTEVTKIPHRVQLHPGISQRQCQLERRFPLPPAFACDRARPQWPQQSYSIRRRTRLPHPLARPTPSWTLHRACQSGGLAPSAPSSGLGGLTLSPHDFQVFHQHGPRMRVDDLDAPPGEFDARAPLTSLRKVPIAFSLKPHVPAIPSPLPCLQSLLHL